ncbi:dash subunit spc34 [Ophiostoma piceae UAMH 11346]|uniref:DASH complex subunit SPC34 n=1 Tax=Ophiostoma piceae (strain UAMH 11346) TaxID=1262450 RepID=S3BPU3_OPHP1|nr:dash subunit spc34 [Ophiostoma piceae UAMH 11346]
MSHLSAYLDQISMSCQGISSLPFPPPKVFTNALLYNEDITGLIRDTETHERALFSVPAPAKTAPEAPEAAAAAAAAAPDTATGARRRQTVFNVTGGEVTTGPPSARPSAAPRRQTAVAAVLGGDLHAQIEHRHSQKNGGDVDVNILLKGAEKLCSVYALPGALERIPVLRQKHAQQANTLIYYENKVAEQAQRLEEMNRWRGGGDGDDDNDDDTVMAAAPVDGPTEEDLRLEEEEIRELERKKKELQERLRAMDKDLGGLLITPNNCPLFPSLPLLCAQEFGNERLRVLGTADLKLVVDDKVRHAVDAARKSLADLDIDLGATVVGAVVEPSTCLVCVEAAARGRLDELVVRRDVAALLKVELEQAVDDRVLVAVLGIGSSFVLLLGELDDAVGIARVAGLALVGEVDALGRTHGAHAGIQMRHPLGTELGGHALVDGHADLGGVGVEVKGQPGDSKAVVGAAGHGLLVDLNGLFQAFLAEVALGR